MAFISQTNSSQNNVKTIEIDFGALPVSEMLFTFNDENVSASSKVIGWLAYVPPTGKELDELDMDSIDLKFSPGNGSFSIYAKPLDGYVADKFVINYLIG